MGTYQLVGLGIRLFAVFLVIYAFQLAGQLIAIDAAWPLYALTLAPCIVAAVLLWMFPKTVASRVLPALPEGAEAEPLSADGVQAIGCSLLGLWVLATAVPDALWWAVYAWQLGNAEYGMQDELSAQDTANVILTGVEIAIGLWLLFGTRGLRGMLRRFRQAGS